jgi:hypothetical protein
MIRLRTAECERAAPGRSLRWTGMVPMLALALLAGTAPAIAAARTPTDPSKQTRERSIAEENSLPGDGSWLIQPHDAASSGEIQGYAGATSVGAGDTLSVFVSTRQDNDPVVATVYRIGWYQGAGAHRYQRLSLIGHDQGWWSNTMHTGQGLPPVPADTGLVDLGWRPSFAVTIGPDWRSGAYLIRLDSGLDRKSAYVFFVVRASTPAAPILYVVPVNTYQAYNFWGGTSLYGSYDELGTRTAKTPATEVSFNRPYDSESGAGLFLSWDVNLVRFLERKSIDVDYVADTDLSENPSVTQTYRGLMFGAHAEYWTQTMRDAAVRARDRGISLAFLGANSAYWRIRYVPDASGRRDRVFVCFKLTPDPNKDPATATGMFQSASVHEPSADLAGERYGSEGVGDATVMATKPAWLFSGTGLGIGDVIRGIVGYEYDQVDTGHKPSGFSVLFHGLVSLVGVALGSAASTLYDGGLYTAPSGAIVFDVGTIQFSWGLDPFGHDSHKVPTNSGLQVLTANLLNHFAATAPGLPAAPSGSLLSQAGHISRLAIVGGCAAILAVIGVVTAALARRRLRHRPPTMLP